MIIRLVTGDSLGTVIAGLVKQGLTFEAYYDHATDSYTIELTGGY